MTPADPLTHGRAALAALYPEDRTPAFIAYLIRRESPDGEVHTWHECPCGRSTCRRLRCADCWRDALAVLEGGAT